MAGSFNEQQRNIYTAVLNAQRAVYAIMKEGVSWVDCHLAAERAILRQLLSIGVLVGNAADETLLDELARLRVGSVFFPHGLGHLIGCDTHDVGG